MPVNEEVASFEWTDEGQLGRSARIFFTFVANSHPGSHLKIARELSGSCFAFGTRSAGPELDCEVQVIDLNLAITKWVLNRNGRGKAERFRIRRLGLDRGTRRAR